MGLKLENIIERLGFAVLRKMIVHILFKLIKNHNLISWSMTFSTFSIRLLDGIRILIKILIKYKWPVTNLTYDFYLGKKHYHEQD